MSTSLEFRHLAIKIPRPPSVPGPFLGPCAEAIYMVLVEDGANNCFDEKNRLARRWSCCMIGGHYLVMRAAIELSLYVERGLTQFYRDGRRGTKPENYIRHYRRLLDNPAPADVSEAILSGISVSFSLSGDMPSVAENLPLLAPQREDGRFYQASASDWTFRFSADAAGLWADLAGLAILTKGKGFNSPIWFDFGGALDYRIECELDRQRTTRMFSRSAQSAAA